MPLKKEPCRNFQRGSCRYGDKCKFLHVTQQQPKSNVFGFGGSQTGTPFQQSNVQQQTPNPFGFGVPNSGQANGAPNSGGFKQSNAFKPFENKWTRSEQPANQAQATSHKCRDPGSCKRQIEEDFQQEQPLWKLTCYGHYKHLPCDITGDISFEELRAVAYDEAKRGISLQAIVERERGLLNSKLAEFENLRRNPYTKQAHAAPSNQNPFSAAGPAALSLTAQNTGPPPASSFSQLNPSPNMPFGVRPSMPSNSGFAQFQGSPGFGANNTPSGPFSSQQVPALSGGGPFGSQVPTQTGGSPFGVQPPLAQTAGSPFGNNQVPAQNSGSPFGVQAPAQTSGSPFGSQVPALTSGGPFSIQVPAQTGGSPFNSIMSGFGNNFMSSQGNQQQPSTVSVSPQNQSQPPMFPNGLNANNGIGQMSTNIDNALQDVAAVDASIWLKEEWKLGEIPEQPPPTEYIK